MCTAKTGFSLLELLIAAAFVSVLALSSVAVFRSHTDAVRVAEAKATMQMMMDRARSVYQRTEKAPNTLAELKLTTGEVTTQHFTTSSYKFNSSGKNWQIICEWVYEGSNPPHLKGNVNLVTGASSFQR